MSNNRRSISLFLFFYTRSRLQTLIKSTDNFPQARTALQLTITLKNCTMLFLLFVFESSKLVSMKPQKLKLQSNTYQWIREIFLLLVLFYWFICLTLTVMWIIFSVHRILIQIDFGLNSSFIYFSSDTKNFKRISLHLVWQWPIFGQQNNKIWSPKVSTKVERGVLQPLPIETSKRKPNLN